MKTVYGPSIPPHVTSATRGHLKVRVDRVVLDLDPVTSIVGDAARKVVETPFLSFHWWGGEEQRSPVICASSLVTRATAQTLVFPIKTSRPQIEHYFGHMATARSGLEIRVLAHDVRKNSAAEHHTASTGATSSATHAETASASIGRALIRLDEMSPAHPMSGWHSVVALPEDSKGFSPIAATAAHCVLGRIKLSVTIDFFAAHDGPAEHVVMVAEREGAGSGGDNSGRQSRTSTPPQRLKSTLPPPQREDSGEGLVVVGRGIPMPGEQQGGGGNDASVESTTSARGSRPTSSSNNNRRNTNRSRSNSAENRGAAATRKPPVPTAGRSTRPSDRDTEVINEEADELFKAGLKLRQQLSDAAQHDNVEDVMQRQRERARRGGDDDEDGGDPYAPLSLRVPPNDERFPGERVTDALMHNDSDDDSDNDAGAAFHYFDPVAFASMSAVQQQQAMQAVMRKQQRREEKRRRKEQKRGGGQQQPQQPQQQQYHHQQQQQAPPPQQQQPLDGTQRPPSGQTSLAAGLHSQGGSNAPSRPSPVPFPPGSAYNPQQQQQQQQQQQMPAIINTKAAAASSVEGKPLSGSFVVRVCIGQLALQSPCSAVKLVARFSPDVLFTSPPELGCFVSPDVELPIADDDVVGFNVSGIRRLSTGSRVVIELYAKARSNNGGNVNTNSHIDSGDEFSLVGICMAPVCGSAATSGGVLKNVVLRNPLNAGSVHAQCDVYINFFQEMQGENEDQQQNQQQQKPIQTLPAGVRPFVGVEEQQQTQPNQQPQQQQTQQQPPSRSNSPQEQQDDMMQRQPSTSSSQNNNNGKPVFARRNSTSSNASSSSNALVATQENNTNNNGVLTVPRRTLSVKIFEGRNLRLLRDGDSVVPPSCFAVIDDVMLSGKNNINNNNGSPSSPTALAAVEMPALNWQVHGPDATFVAPAATHPQFPFETKIEVSDAADIKQLSRVCISVHHCRSAELAEHFGAGGDNNGEKKKRSNGIALDPERDENVIALLEQSVELGIISIPTKNLAMMPYDGWAHAVDSVTGDSVGQFRIRCELV